jgi:4-diphosphocytidyl-2-C-methyl-D-erythritol kinase
MTVTLPCPAKINLFLHVVGRQGDRPLAKVARTLAKMRAIEHQRAVYSSYMITGSADNMHLQQVIVDFGKRSHGYHLLESLVCFADYGDTLTLAKSTTTTLTIIGEFAPALHHTPLADNLIIKAQRALEQHTQRPLPTAFTLQKNLPLGGGIGGGSANAAATLKGLCALYNLSISPDTLHHLATTIGADVPVCLASTPSLMTGIGEHVSPVSLPCTLNILLVTPPIHVPTKDVFKALQGNFSAPLPPLALDTEEALKTLLHNTRNDLEAPALALFPALQEPLSILTQQHGCWLTRLSGSGATCFGLFATAAQATTAATKIKQTHPAWWIKRC